MYNYFCFFISFSLFWFFCQSQRVDLGLVNTNEVLTWRDQNGKGACMEMGVNSCCSFYFRLHKSGLGPKQKVYVYEKSGCE